MSAPLTLTVLNRQVVACRKCARLVHYREGVARSVKEYLLTQSTRTRPARGGVA